VCSRALRCKVCRRSCSRTYGGSLTDMEEGNYAQSKEGGNSMRMQRRVMVG
jgi:hypothetical protein